MDKFVSQKSIYMVKLDGVGSEQRGERPCLVVSSAITNQYSNVVVIVPLTTKTKTAIPTHHTISPLKYHQLKADSVVLCEQIRAIDKRRIGDFLFTMDKEDFVEVIKKININLRVF